MSSTLHALSASPSPGMCEIQPNTATDSQLSLHPGTADRIEALCFLALTASLGYVTASGQYTSFATPRTLPYLVIAVVLLAALSMCAWLGFFHATPRSAARLLIGLAIPTLLITIPAQASATSRGFDEYAGGRAIAIDYSNGEQRLAGLDAATKTITIANDDFGAWYQVIDHNPERYRGYTVKLTGFVSKPHTLGAGQLQVSRQLMSCCILDMTPFGFTSEYSGASKLHEHDWVQVTATLSSGTIGRSGYSHQGWMLKVNQVSQTSAPTGYFYQP